MFRRIFASLLILAGLLLITVGQVGYFGAELLKDPNGLAGVSKRIVTSDVVEAQLSDRLTDAFVARLPRIDPVTGDPYPTSELAERKTLVHSSVEQTLQSKSTKKLLGEAIDTLVAKTMARDISPIAIPMDGIRNEVSASMITVDQTTALALPANVEPIIVRQGTAKTFRVAPNSPTIDLPYFPAIRNNAQTLRNGGFASGAIAITIGLVLHPKRRRTLIHLGFVLMTTSLLVVFAPINWVANRLDSTDPLTARAIVRQLVAEFRWYGVLGALAGVGVIFVGELALGGIPKVSPTTPLRWAARSAWRGSKRLASGKSEEKRKKMFFQSVKP